MNKTSVCLSSLDNVGTEPFKKAARISVYDSQWGLVIFKAENGFLVKTIPEKEFQVFENPPDSEGDVDATMSLLWFILEHFNVNKSRYAEKVVRVVEEAGEKYTLKSDEKFEEERICRVVKKVKGERKSFDE